MRRSTLKEIIGACRTLARRKKDELGTGELYRFMALQLQMQIRFLLNEEIVSAWHAIERRRHSGSPRDRKAASIEYRKFLWSHGIKEIRCSTFRGHKIPEPEFWGPDLETVEVDVCANCYSRYDLSDRKPAKCRLCGARKFFAADFARIVVFRSTKETDCRDLWRLAQTELSHQRDERLLTRIAPKLERNLRWAEMYRKSESISQIVRFELETKRAYWENQFDQDVEPMLTKRIREALRKLGVLTPSR